MNKPKKVMMTKKCTAESYGQSDILFLYSLQTQSNAIYGLWICTYNVKVQKDAQ